MSTLEDTLRSAFEEDAQAAPDGTDVARRVIERTRRRTRARRATITVGLVAAATATIVVVPSTLDGDRRDRSTTASRSSTSPTTPTEGTSRSGPLPGSAVSCVEQYSPREVMDRAFAFDGTVAAIGPGNTDRGDEGDLGYAGVTFEVHEWFRGGDTPTITIDLEPPGATVEGRPAYDVGTRLLVSGEHRWGGSSDADLLGWGCGFTRYHDPVTAEAWRRAAR